MRFLSFIFLSGFFSASLSAETPSLLAKAADRWLGERDQWAFTQFVREFDGDTVKEERVERYDPSQPGIGRWHLLSIGGTAPTDERRAEWQKRKTKKRKNPGKSLSEYLEFEKATVASESAKVVSYLVPLRNNSSWLFPVDRIELKVSINKATEAIEQVEAKIEEPFRVALGLGKVLDLDFDVQMNPSPPPGKIQDPAAAKPDGTARAVVNKLGERVEYAWSDFKRVTPHPDNVIAPAASHD